MANLIFHEQAWEDYLYWQNNDQAMIKRINELIKDIRRSPFEGIGKPETLKHQLAGFWSRRMNHEHRLVYTVIEGAIVFAQCKYHY